MSIRFWAMAVVLVVVLVSFAAVIPSKQRAVSSAFGDWSPAVKISNEDMFWGDVSEFAIYKYGLTNLTYSGDFGSTWIPEKAMGGRIDAVGGTIYRVNSTDPYSGNLFYESSTDNGTSWSAPHDLDLPAANDGFFGICLLNGTLFVYDWDSYGTGDMLIRKSADNGNSWSPTVVVTYVTMTDPLTSDLIFKDGTLFMAYSEEIYTPPFTYTYNIILIRSQDMGDTWGDKLVLGIGANPVIKEDNGKLYMTYIHYEIEGMNVFFMINFTTSLDGIAWTPQVTVARFTDVTDPTLIHSLAVSNGRIAVGYLDYRIAVPSDTYTVRINYSYDDGNTWSDLGDVTGMSSNAEGPTVYILGDTLHFFWVDLETGDWTSEPNPTYYRAMDLTGGPVIPEFPALAVPVLCVLAILAIASNRRVLRL